MAKRFISTEQLCEATGQSERTIHRWAKNGWLPRPVLAPMPKGRGRRALWPAHTITVVREIEEHRNTRGMSAGDAARAVILKRAEASDTIKELSRSPVNFFHAPRDKQSAERIVLAELTESIPGATPSPGDVNDLFVFLILEQLLPLAPQGSELQQKVHAALKDQRPFEAAAELFSWRFRPIGIYSNDLFQVVPSFFFDVRRSGLTSIVLDLAGTLRRTAQLGGLEPFNLGDDELAEVAEKAWRRDEDGSVVEYDVEIVPPQIESVSMYRLRNPRVVQGPRQ